MARATHTRAPAFARIAIHALLAAAAAFACFRALRLRDARAAARAPATVRFLSMGTIASVSIYGGADAATAAGIVRDAFSEVESGLSVFRPDSFVSKLNANGEALLPAPEEPTGFSPARAVAFALEAAEKTGGAFDPTVNPLMRLWGFRGATPSEPPDDAGISAALARTGWRRLSLSPAGGEPPQVLARFDAQGMELDLGGVAKGYAVDLAFERLRAAGTRDFLIDLGGNIRVSGRPAPDRDTWRVAVRDPAAPERTTGETVSLRDGEAIATSGSYERFVEIGGRRFSHIIDPRTGHPAARQGSVSVIAPTAMAADAFSTAYFVLGRGAENGSATVIPLNGDQP